jgi:flagellar hook-length control protein FliK
VDLAVSPATVVAPNPQQGTALPALRTGEVVEAQVLQSAGNAAKIAIGNTILEVLTQVALTPGATVKLAVSNSPQGLRLTLVGNPGDGASAGTAGGTSNSGTAVSPQTPPVLTTSATAAEVAASPDESVPAVTPSAPAVTAGGTPTNVTAATGTSDLQAPVPSLNPVAAATAALAAAVQTSAARQGGLGPLFADAGVAATIPVVPEPVRQAAERLLALQPALDETISAGDVKQALDRSGLFLEARLSAAAEGSAAPAGSVDDLKAALVVLRNVVKSWLATDLPDLVTPDASSLQAEGILGRAALALDPDGGTQTTPNAQAAVARAPSTPVSTPPPPYRGAPTAGQAAAAPSISADTAPRDIGKVLLNETDAALARQTLLQAASLPDHVAASLAANGAAVRNDPSGPRWLFEVPFATPQGSAVAQFEIARDGHNAPAAGTTAAWRARFSLDVEPIGPVHAQIALIGTRAAVTLWAERPETSTQLREGAPQLADALRQADLDLGDVLVRAGTPPRPREAVASGRFLDRAS